MGRGNCLGTIRRSVLLRTRLFLIPLKNIFKQAEWMMAFRAASDLNDMLSKYKIVIYIIM